MDEMSVHHSFSWHLLKENKEHLPTTYSSIYGKEIYSVAVFDFEEKGYYDFENKSRYNMVR